MPGVIQRAREEAMERGMERGILVHALLTSRLAGARKQADYFTGVISYALAPENAARL